MQSNPSAMPRIQLEEQDDPEQTIAQLEAIDWSDGPYDVVCQLTASD